jgi:hypothetical protein
VQKIKARRKYAMLLDRKYASLAGVSYTPQREYVPDDD